MGLEKNKVRGGKGKILFVESKRLVFFFFQAEDGIRDVRT